MQVKLSIGERYVAINQLSGNVGKTEARKIRQVRNELHLDELPENSPSSVLKDEADYEVGSVAAQWIKDKLSSAWDKNAIPAVASHFALSLEEKMLTVLDPKAEGQS